jgi:predicted nucleotidyltransferase
MAKKPIRLRDFVEDRDGWLYAVSVYDNRDRVGCVLRYVPDREGERVDREGRRYRKLDFDDAFKKIRDEKPEYADIVQRVPLKDIKRIYKPEEELESVVKRDIRVQKLVKIFGLPPVTVGVTGSFLVGLEAESSDIDMVVYGRKWFHAQELLRYAIAKGKLEDLDEELWKRVYEKRRPELSPDEFMLHERRKWNRGQIDGTYFDLLYTRSYKNLNPAPIVKGTSNGRITIEATVTDASLSYDNPAVYIVEHESISRILSFTHTYSGQALKGETVEARGVCEQHGEESWLIIGTTREAKGEYLKSRTLLEETV